MVEWGGVLGLCALPTPNFGEQGVGQELREGEEQEQGKEKKIGEREEVECSLPLSP